MPFFEAADKLPSRPPIILIYGEEGTGKTSLSHTCEEPLHFDFDNGLSRSKGRKTSFKPDSWHEVIEHEGKGTYRNYKTVCIDTAKAALDDFLVPYVMDEDYSLKKNKLQRFGAIGDCFKIFLLNRRKDNVAILILAHAKKDEDTKRKMPDITGQSLQLIMRMADQVGYISYRNNARVITFDPTENSVGKNVACMPTTEVPAMNDPKYKTFGMDLIEKVRKALDEMSEEQREAMEKSNTYQELINNAAHVEELNGLADTITALPDYLSAPLIQVLGDRYTKDIFESETPEVLNPVFKEVNELPEFLKKPLRISVSEHAKKKGWVANAVTKGFEDPNAKAPESVPPAVPALFTPEQEPATTAATTPITEPENK